MLINFRALKKHVLTSLKMYFFGMNHTVRTLRRCWKCADACLFLDFNKVLKEFETAKIFCDSKVRVCIYTQNMALSWNSVDA